jgi:hypothetical protein
MTASDVTAPDVIARIEARSRQAAAFRYQSARPMARKPTRARALFIRAP